MDAPRFELHCCDADGSNEELVDDNLDLADFARANADGLEVWEIDPIKALEVGAEHRMGGGAAPIFTVKRVA
jgi:hypothetical protein